MQNSKRDTDIQNSLLDSVGEGEGGVIWENGIETRILSYVKRTTSPGSMQNTGCLGPCSRMTQRDGMEREMRGGSGWGPRVHPWWIYVNVWQNQYNTIK